MARTDIHRPSAIIPTDYEFVGMICPVISIGDCRVVDINRGQIKRHMDRTGGDYSHHTHGGSCHICGAHCVYLCVYYHELTNTYIRTGMDCAEKLDMACAREDMTAFRTACKEAQDLTAGKRKAQATLTAEGLDAAWAIYLAEYNPAYEESTIRDIVGKLVKYGSVSDKQFAFVRSLLARIDNRAAAEAQRQAQREAAKPVPTGKVQIEGLVVSTKVQDTMYGSVIKMVVVSDDGWKVFGTVPDSLLGNSPLKGALVRFNATVEASQDDNKFGFFKRPTKADVLILASA